MPTAPHPYLLISTAAYLAWRFGKKNLSPWYPPACSPLCYFLIAAAIYSVLYWAIPLYLQGAMILTGVPGGNAAMYRFPPRYARTMYGPRAATFPSMPSLPLHLPLHIP